MIDKILVNMRYKAKVQWTMVAWYLPIYIASVALVCFTLIKTSVIGPNTGSLFYRLWGSVIFQFAIAMRFKEDFDFLLTMSSTRKEIFLSLAGVLIGFSGFFSALIVIERLMVDYLNRILGYNNITDYFHFVSPYATKNVFDQFMFFLLLGASLVMFGLLMGSLFYRFGKKFMMAFWLIFSAAIMIVLPAILWTLHLRSQLSDSMNAFGDFLKNFDLTIANLILLLVALVFGAAAWLNMRRLPQK